ncbi:MAG TPA: flagellin, partial [Chloroflexota bacterium]
SSPAKPYLADYQDPQPQSEPNSALTVLGLVVKLGLVIGLIYLITLGLRYFGNRGRKVFLGNNSINVLEKTALAQNRELYLVDVVTGFRTMSISINTNINAFDAQRNLNNVGLDFSQSVARLSSGLRINKASDDAAGLAISEQLRTQINGFQVGGRNAQDSISMLQTGESALNTTHAMLQRMRELAVQASNDTYTNTDRKSMQLEINQLVQEIDRIASQTDFNTKKLLNGSAGAAQVAGGGPDVKGLIVQAGVALAGTYSLTSVSAALKSAWEANAVAAGSSFTQTSSMTINGGQGSATFTAFAGETLETFFQSVNGSQIGATMSIDQATGNAVIINKGYGIFANTVGGANGDNTTGEKAVSVQSATGDFGAGLGLAMNFGGGTSASVDAAGAVVTGANGSNAVLSVTVTPAGGASTGAVTLTATGANSDTLSGVGQAAGMLITLNDPGVTPGGDLFTVTQNAALQFQVGANANQTIGLNINAADTQTLGVTNLGVLTQSQAETAIGQLDRAIQRISDTRATIGAIQNRLTSSMQNDASAQENALTAFSNIRDTNVAEETVAFTRAQILQSAGVSVLAQANQQPAAFLSLLK